MIIYHQSNKEGQAGNVLDLGFGQPMSSLSFTSLELNPQAGAGYGYLQAAYRGFRTILLILSGVEA